MAENLNQTPSLESELDLTEIYKILIKSKKLIISSILIFIIASVIYSLTLKPEFKSSTILEIGYTILPDGTQKSIEAPSDLISNLNLYQFLYHQETNKGRSFKAIENKLILIETTSRSAEQNESFLTELISYIDKRHSNLSSLKNNISTDQISLNLETVNSQIAFIKEKQIDKNKEKKLTISLELDSVNSQIAFIKEKQISDIEGRLYILTNELPIIDLEISQLEKVIIQDSNNLSLLEDNNMLKARAANSPTLEEIIFSYKSKINSLSTKKSSYILEAKTLNNKLENVLLQSEELFNLEQRKKTLENELQNLENASIQSEGLFNLEQRQKILENELQILITQTHVNTRIIGNTETVTIKPKTTLIISLGIIFGFITGIFLVFIISFIKSFKESLA